MFLHHELQIFLFSKVISLNHVVCIVPAFKNIFESDLTYYDDPVT